MDSFPIAGPSSGIARHTWMRLPGILSIVFCVLAFSCPAAACQDDTLSDAAVSAVESQQPDLADNWHVDRADDDRLPAGNHDSEPAPADQHRRPVARDTVAPTPTRFYHEARAPPRTFFLTFLTS